MKMYLRKAMQNVATYVELALSAFLTIVIVVLIVKLIGESFFHLNGEGPELSYYLESAMTLAIGIEFVKMLCTHTPGTIIEVLLFATSRQMIVEHLEQKLYLALQQLQDYLQFESTYFVISMNQIILSAGEARRYVMPILLQV